MALWVFCVVESPKVKEVCGVVFFVFSKLFSLVVCYLYLDY